MARQLKPMQVGDVWLKGVRTRVPLMLDRNTNRFFVVYGTERVDAESAYKAKQLAEEQLGKVAYAWEPVILVEVDKGKSDFTRSHEQETLHVTGLGLEFRRMERSPDPSRQEKYVKRPHPLDVEADDTGFKARQREAFKDVTSAWWDQGATVIPYTEDMWQALLAIEEAVEQAHGKLQALLSGEGVEARLRRIAQVGTKLLGGGSRG